MKTKKHGKEKKHKKEKKKRETSSSSETSSEDEKMEWIEAPSSSHHEPKREVSQREDWMQDESFVPTYSRRKSESKRKRLAKSEEEIQREKKILAERELNPYWKDNGEGLPSTDVRVSSAPSQYVGDGGYGFLKKAYKRVQEQAAEEGRSMEDIASERWGSLSKLESMLREAEEHVRGGRLEEKETSYRHPDRTAREENQRTFSSSGRHRSPAQYERERKSDKSSSGRQDRYSRVSPDVDDRQVHKFQSDRHSASKDTGSQRSRRLNYHSSRYQKSSRYDREREPQYEDSRSISPEYRTGEERSDYRREEDTDTSRSGNSSKEDFKHEDFAWNRGKDNRETPERGRFRRPEESSSTRDRNSGHHGMSNQPSWKKKVPTKAASLGNKFVSTDENFFPDTSETVPSKHETSTSKDVSQSSRGHDASSSRSPRNSTDDSESEDEDSKAREKPILNDNELNYLAARAIRARLCGDSELASKIEQDLETAKKKQEDFKVSGGQLYNEHPREDVLSSVIDRYPLPKGFRSCVPVRSGGSTKHVHVGPMRTKHFDDEKMSLQHIFEREKMTSVDDQLKMYVDAASSRRGVMDEECDEDASGKTAEKLDKYPKQERDFHKAIKDHKHLSFALDRCRFCLDKPGLLKHSIVAKGDEVFLCCPPFKSLAEGHCFIVPVTHVSSTLLLEENEYAEVQAFKRGLMKMFGDRGKGMIFMETSIKQRFFPHAAIECIPMPKDTWDLAPFYFKKAIDESEYEWSHNKKLIDLSKKGVRYSVPKGLPFFSVEFGDGSGFAHVIEDDRNFPRHFGREIVGGMLEMDSHEIKEKEEETEEICKKTLKLVNMWWKYKEYFTC